MDYEALFDHSPNAYMVLDRELRFVAANATYLRITASRIEDLLGRRLFDQFPHDPDNPANTPARMVRDSLERVLATGKPDTLALIPYRVPKYVGSEVVIDERFWSATHTPLLDESGAVKWILQNTMDVTELQRSAPRSEPSPHPAMPREQMAAAVLSHAESAQADKEQAHAEWQRLQTLFEQAPGFMCFLEGPTHVFALSNQAYQRIVGDRHIIGKPVGEALPEVVKQGFVELLDRVYTSGQPFVGSSVKVMLQRKSEGPPEEAFLDFIYQPMRGPDGQVNGIFVQGHDVTERMTAEREREAARQAAEALSAEVIQQSKEVKEALEQAYRRIAHLEAELARRG
jgi:PAS domain S-box-containing protein